MLVSTTSNRGWDFIQVMDLIHKKTRERYHVVHIYCLLLEWGFLSKNTTEKICKYYVNKGQKRNSKTVKQILINLES